MQYLIQNREKCRKLALHAVELVKDAFQGQDAQRFGIWALAAALAGGMIAKKLGLIPFSPWGVIEKVVPTLQVQSEETQTPEEQCLDALREWLTQESDRVCFTAGTNLGHVDDPIARRDGPDLYIHSALFKKELRERRISASVIKRLIDREAETRIKARLSSGTPGVWVLRFPASLVYDD